MDDLYTVELDRVRKKVCGFVNIGFISNILILQVEGQRAVLAVDGWSTVTKDPVVGISLNVVGETYLIKTEDTLGKSHTAEYLVQLIIENIKYAEDTFSVRIVGCVTDNASNMVLTRRLLQEQLPKVLFHFW